MRRAWALLGCAALAAATLAGCASRPVQAPVLDRAPPRAAKPAPRPRAVARADTYIVRSGDTMYSIALDHGLDYRELAAWNNLLDPSRIRPGQALRIKPPTVAQEAPVTVHPVTSSGRVEARPLGDQTRPAERTLGAAESVVSEPIARKLPYSPENLALLQQSQMQPAPIPAQEASSAPAATPAMSIAPIAPAAAAAPAATPETGLAGKPDAAAGEVDKVEWGWPAQGKVIAGFSEASNKGLDIAGNKGDPVIASAPGRVVYSGSGLRGYGKLVIIKHNKTYLSAYAHNSEILVKEGQSVVKGQKIAEIGSTDSDKPMLHFEIRKLGKPVDPARYLPPT